MNTIECLKKTLDWVNKRMLSIHMMSKTYWNKVELPSHVPLWIPTQQQNNDRQTAKE